ncbi:MAG: hypothetical protein HYY54_04860 [candidate division NC10 bacterium]|nr:hypothetical protein [candidate division NC10 bacterium]
MLFHGAVVLFIGLACGLPFGTALARGWNDDSVRSWRVAHSGVAGIGVMLIAIGAAVQHMVLGEHAAFLLVWSLVVSAYAFTLAMVLGGIAGVRGLRPSGPALNLVVFVGNMVGVAGSLFGIALAAYGMYGALAGAGAGPG